MFLMQLTDYFRVDTQINVSTIEKLCMCVCVRERERENFDWCRFETRRQSGFN